MIMLIFAAAKTFIAYCIARLKSCKKSPISAEEVIQFKGITKDQYEKVVAPIMWDNKNYYEQLKLDIWYKILNPLNLSSLKPIKVTCKDWLDTSYYKQMKFDIDYVNLKNLSVNKIKQHKDSTVISINDYYKEIEEDYKSLKELFKNRNSGVS